MDGDVDVDTIFDLARRPSRHGSGILVEDCGRRVKVEGRVNVYVAVKLKVWVDVEVVVAVHDPIITTRRRFALHVSRAVRQAPFAVRRPAALAALAFTRLPIIDYLTYRHAPEGTSASIFQNEVFRSDTRVV